MSLLTAPFTRLPLRIQSLVSLTSILVRIQPISSLHSGQQPISRLHSSPSHHRPISSPARTYQTLARGVGSKKEGRSASCPISAKENLNHPISNQYMCGNSHSTMASSSPAVILPRGTHTATFIFLHGLGDQGHNWAENFKMIREPHIKYIFPHAPDMSVTLNMGMVMPSWFDIFTLGFGGKEDRTGIEKASESLLQLIAAEEGKGIAPSRIVIGGFSQGGAVSLYTAITNDRPFAGVVALSSWMPLSQTFKTEGVTKKPLPVMQCHGKADNLLPFSLGQLTHSFLQSQVTNPEFKGLEGIGHSSSPEEMQYVRDFLKKTLP